MNVLELCKIYFVLAVKVIVTLTVNHHGAPDFSFRALNEDKLSIAALEGGLMTSNIEDLAGLPASDAVIQV